MKKKEKKKEKKLLLLLLLWLWEVMVVKDAERPWRCRWLFRLHFRFRCRYQLAGSGRWAIGGFHCHDYAQWEGEEQEEEERACFEKGEREREREREREKEEKKEENFVFVFCVGKEQKHFSEHNEPAGPGGW